MPPLKICLVSAEVSPFAKTGGLADVSAALARYLTLAGHDVRLVMPLYQRVRTALKDLTPVPGLQDMSMQVGARRIWYSIWSAPLPKSTALVYFVRCPELYERAEIYTQDPDEHVRFGLFSRAALEMCQWSQWAPDIVHANDWHTALVPLYLKTTYAWDKIFAQAKSVLTIHNIGYQGKFAASTLSDLALENERKFFYQEDLNAGHVNFLKTGLLFADALTTVSRTYAHEIQGDEHGMGLQGLLRQRDDHLFGIVNGVDYDEWSPEADARIPHRYTRDNLTGKAKMKAALLERVGLPPGPRVPTIGIISRLTGQKGFDLLHDSLTVFFQREDLRLVVLGSGEERYQQYFTWLASTFPSKVAYKQGYDEELPHWIEAGSDLFLMPSRYEPCGLNQMYSLKYGTVPLVRKTGGLADTVQDWNGATGAGTGFVFEKFDAHDFHAALARALAVYRDEKAWKKLVQNGMAQDFSWQRQIGKYVELYEWVRTKA